MRNLLEMIIGRDFVRCKRAYVWRLHKRAKHVFITCRTHWWKFLFMVNYVVQRLTNLAVSHEHNNLAREQKASWYNQLPCYTLPPTQHHSFYRNLPPLAREKFVFFGNKRSESNILTVSLLKPQFDKASFPWFFYLAIYVIYNTSYLICIFLFIIFWKIFLIPSLYDKRSKK